jgi:hypothetical protein
MMTLKRFAAGLLDIAMLVLAINALVILFSVLLRPLALGWLVITTQMFIWLLPFTALVMLLYLALAAPDSAE